MKFSYSEWGMNNRQGKEGGGGEGDGLKSIFLPCLAAKGITNEFVSLSYSKEKYFFFFFFI